jgi:hypothetical protein
VTPEEYRDVKQCYKLAIAYDSFTEVGKSCKFAIGEKLKSADPGYYAIAVGIVTLYARPFTDNAKIGKLSPKLVPTEFQDVHSALINLRNKAFSHSDSDGALDGHGKMTEVRFSFDGRYFASFSSRPVFEPVLLPSIDRLAELLAVQVKKQSDEVFEKILRAVIPTLRGSDVGKEFELNLEDEKGPMVVRATEAIAHKYPVVRPPADT